MRSHTLMMRCYSQAKAGSSYVLAEAMVYEIPIIAAKAHGVSEVVGRKRGWLFVDYKEFKAAIISLKKYDGRMAYHQRQFMRKYCSRSKVIDSQKKLMRSLI